MEHIINKALEKDRETRYQTASDLRADLKRLKRDTESGRSAAVAPVSPPVATIRTSAAQRRWTIALAGVAVLVAAGMVLWLLLRTPLAPKVLGIRQITHTGREKGLAGTDGARVYFRETVGGHPTPMAVPAAGGDAVPIPMTLKDAYVGAISPDNGELIVESPLTATGRNPIWRVPVLGGSPRRIGDLVSNFEDYTPDGRGLPYTHGPDVYFANADGTGSRRLFSVPEMPYFFRYSPDGSRLRFSVMGSNHARSSIWEASADGSDLHRFLPDWNAGGSECCGTWTPDGKHYVFQATVAGNSNIWALREGRLFGKSGHEPVQLTTGPMQIGGFDGPLVSKDGKKIFFVGTQSNAELSVYDSRLHEFVPYLSGIPAESVSFSKDGQWVAYVRLPEGTLWRMRMDGTEQLQLTFPPMKVFLPRWSPDGKRLAFWDLRADGHSKVYTISADGGAPEALTSGEHNEGDPTWSPDGNSLVFTTYCGGSPDSSIRVLDLKTRQVTDLPGSKGIYSPRCSPDGRYVAALTSGEHKVMLFDFKTQKWEKPGGPGASFLNRSKDGKYVFFAGLEAGRAPGFYRVDIATRKTEEVVRLGEAHAANSVAGNFPWYGITPDGSPLIARQVGTQEIYALDVDFP